MTAEEKGFIPIKKLGGKTTTSGRRYVGYSMCIGVCGIETVITAPTKAGLLDICGKLCPNVALNFEMVLETCTFEASKVIPIE